MASSVATGSVEEQLFACLFPGQRYGPHQAAALAARLREVAGALEEAPKVEEVEAEEPDTKRPRKEPRPPRDIDFGSYQQRYVALELLYLGHDYGGFARQATTEETIEGQLFAALRTTRLVPPDASWQDLRYSRGGRTDKGVSALGQVVALLLRSSARAGEPALDPGAELDYPTALNRVLPRDIRVLGWADAPDGFSARFSARHREYRYLIAYRPAGQAGQPPPGGEAGEGEALPPCEALDVDSMRAAAAAFVGDHDFRNFCKVDVAQVTNFRRRVLEFRLEPLGGCAWGGRRLLQLHIRGTAFLWHQVRCMAAVLLMVGRGEEAPSVVAELLDMGRVPCKPQYSLASEEPLLLYSCAYDGLHFRRSPRNIAAVRTQLEAALCSHMVRAGMLHTVQQRLADDQPREQAAVGGRECGGAPARSRHVPLLQRAREPAVEERLLKLQAARGGLMAAEGPV